jgi:hypothetical protein
MMKDSEVVERLEECLKTGTGRLHPHAGRKGKVGGSSPGKISNTKMDAVVQKETDRVVSKFFPGAQTIRTWTGNMTVYAPTSSDSSRQALLKAVYKPASIRDLYKRGHLHAIVQSKASNLTHITFGYSEREETT